MAGYPNKFDPFAYYGIQPPPGAYSPPPAYSEVTSGGYNMAQYFYIRSRLNGFVLDIQGESTAPGTRVITWNQKGSSNQLWYQDGATGTIRSKMSPNLCLQPAGGGVGLIVQNYNPADPKQQLQISGTTIHMRSNPQNVVTVIGKNMAAGGKVGMNQASGEMHQQWDIVPEQGGFQAAPAAPQPQTPGYFFIRSNLNAMVIDIRGGTASHGTRVVTWPQKARDYDNQLWYEDAATMTYRSKLAPNLCLTPAGDGTGLKVLQYTPGDQRQLLCLTGNKLHMRSKPNKVVDISGAQVAQDGKLIMHDWHGRANQQWQFVPCPAAGTPPGQGVSAPAYVPPAYVPPAYVPPASAPNLYPEVPAPQAGWNYNAKAGRKAERRMAAQAQTRPVWSLRRSPGSAPPDALPLGHQNDGAGQLWLAVAHSQWGDIPGKAAGATCWFPYGGKEQLAGDFSWVCAPPGSYKLVNNTGRVPPGAMQVGYQHECASALYAALANTQYGHVPGKVYANNPGTCFYSYGGMEQSITQFFWVTC